MSDPARSRALRISKLPSLALSHDPAALGIDLDRGATPLANGRVRQDAIH